MRVAVERPVMTEPGRIRETYHAAVQHDIVDLAADEHLAGVVRRPTGWFHNTVDANYPALGPPESLLDDTKARQDELAAAGLCDTEAHNAAWAETDFAARYREYLDESADARASLDGLAERVRAGEPVVLVCFEGEDKRCHRHLLRERLRAMVG
jgi:uncharacterized protein YeaO (DUF488 family)